MSGYAFIWIFLSKVRLAIKNTKASAQAFVSLRIMINAKETYRVYRDIELEKASGKMDMVTNPKTLKDTMDSFFELFKPAQKDAIINEVDYTRFLQIVEEKNKMPYYSSADKTKSNDFNTPSEMTEAQSLIDRMNAEL